MENTLFKSGFRYDNEDNLWYDENAKRTRYLLRAGLSEDRKKVELFKGGYDNKIGIFKTKEDLINAIKAENND